MAIGHWTFLAVLLVGGCASSDTVSLLASDGQQAITRDGAPSLISAKRNIVMFQSSGEAVQSGQRPSFVIAVQNLQPTMVNFSPAGISAKAIDEFGQTKPLKVFSYAELVAEEKRRQTGAAVGAALLGASRAYNASNAGYSNTYGTFNARNNYGATASGTYSASTYNSYQAYSAQQLASAQTSADFAHIRREGSERLAAMRGSIIREQTMRSGEWYGGTIVLEIPKKARDGSVGYVIDLEFDGEHYSFNVKQSKSAS